MLKRVVRKHPFLFGALVIGSVFGLYAWHWWRTEFPYGWTHCCDKGLAFSLQEYADDHAGALPAGGETPEASLSLLYPKYANHALLDGKTVPLESVRAILESGGRLAPETCGWHYVEGLRKDDDPRFVVFYDKVGLNHNGRRLPSGAREVMRLGSLGFVQYIDAEQWPILVNEQRRLIAELRAKGRFIRASDPNLDR